MRAELTQEQVLLRDTLMRLLADTYPFETRRGLLTTPEGWSRALWSNLAELGLLAVAAPEALGGLGGGLQEIAVLAEALGASLSAEPVLPTAVLAVGLLAGAGRDEDVERLVTGQEIVAVALDPLRITDDGRLAAVRLISLPWADRAERLLAFVAREGGLALIRLDLDRAEVTRRPHRTFDGLAAADVDLAPMDLGAVESLAEGIEAERLFAWARAAQAVWLSAEAVGLMQVALDTTVEHLKSRVQFGQPLAEFQALQHRSAEMLVALEQARSAVLLAASAAEGEDGEPDRLAATLILSESARIVGQAAVQLHGGIGVTDEHIIGWIFRRLTLIELELGDADRQARRLADLGGLVDLD